jgi:hypothetical protein
MAKLRTTILQKRIASIVAVEILYNEQLEENKIGKSNNVFFCIVNSTRICKSELGFPKVFRMHSNLTSFKKPKIQFSQCQDAQTPNKPVSKQPTFIMPNLQNSPTSKCSVLMHAPSRGSCQLAKEVTKGGHCDPYLPTIYG